MPVRDDYLDTGETAVGLLRNPAVAQAWVKPSALAEMSVGGLAAHLARHIMLAPKVLALGAPEDGAGPVTLIDHYGEPMWQDEEANAAVVRGSEESAAKGPEAVAERAATVLGELRGALAAEPADRVVWPPWAAAPLTLTDFLITRMVELVVHTDDLAVSVDVDTPLPPGAVETVTGLLTRLAVRRHGATAVLRALSRSERAPATISAF